MPKYFIRTGNENVPFCLLIPAVRSKIAPLMGNPYKLYYSQNS